MKKIIALIVIVLLYIGSAYAISYSAESALHNYADQISTRPGYNAELSDFRHGLLSSSARFRVDMDTDMILAGLEPAQREQMGPVIEAMKQGLPFRVDIFQGPLVFRNGLFAGLFKAEFTLGDEVEWARELRDTLERDSIMDNELRMGFTGQGSGYLRMDPFREGDNVFGGMQIDYQLADFGSHVSAQGEISPSTFSNDDGTLRMGLSSFSSSGELSDDFINDGDFNVHISSIETIAQDRTMFDLRDLRLDFDASIDEDNEDRFSMHYRIDVEGIEGDALEQPITGIQFDMALLNLDRSAFNEFYRNSVASSDMEDPFAAQMLMMEAASRLLEGDPALRISNIAFEQGPDINMTLSGALSFGEDVGNVGNAQNPFMLLDHLIVDLDLQFTPGFFSTVSESYVDGQMAGLEMEPAFIEQMREQQLQQHRTFLQQLVQAGMIAFDGDRYSIVLAMEDGQFTVNGNPMPLPF